MKEKYVSEMVDLLRSANQLVDIGQLKLDTPRAHTWLNDVRNLLYKLDEEKPDPPQFILKEIADEVNGKYRTYSGRGMNGRECMAISCERYEEDRVIELAVEQGITGAHIDSLGLRVIVYWPGLKVEEGAESD